MAKGITGKALLKMLTAKGCTVLRQRGSHVMVRCGTCHTTVPVHGNDTLPAGTLRAIERHLEPCLGKGWLGEK